LKKLLLFAVAAVMAYGYLQGPDIGLPGASGWRQEGNSAVTAAYRDRQSDVQVQGEGVVTRVLPDDLDGSRHQRFVLDVGAGQTVLVAHNIDLAPRVRDLQTGDTVEFYGEYEWNEKGGVVHWTHRDPQNRHPAGWLKHAGATYQ